MAITVYDLSVPIYSARLKALKTILKKGEDWCDENKKPHSTLLEGRIIEDMLPLPKQIQILSNAVKFTLVRVAGLEAPVMEDNETTFADLYARIDKTIELCDNADRTKFDGTESKTIDFKVGQTELRMDGLSYVQGYAVPNFFFHVVTAYNILRSAGVQIGKADYLMPPGGMETYLKK